MAGVRQLPNDSFNRTMKKHIRTTLGCIAVALALTGCAHTTKTATSNDRPQGTENAKMNAQQRQTGRYATVNGLKMYYEIHGSGRPLVLIHGGGSTITSTFGRILPDLAKTHQVIAVELQAHGHTLDIDRPLSFQQDADDVAALLNPLSRYEAA